MKYENRREVELLVLSDIHLGTYGCHAVELVRYLKSVRPKTLVLNGDIIDMWQFSKNYFPASHMAVLKEILRMLSHGSVVYYITGNHDEMLRKFAGLNFGNLTIDNKLVLHLDGKKTWIFHGDVFDVSMKYSKWAAKLGGKGYDILILVNRWVNKISEKMGRGKISLSKKIKESVKAAVKYIANFEDIAINLALDKDFDYVICGHIHQPTIRQVNRNDKSIIYLNSGDWIENLTSLEYHNREWSLIHFEHDKINLSLEEEQLDFEVEASYKELFAAFSLELQQS
jgi:UDP-2,3-diacylglucosamine pyrophosphatase LpxH